MCYLVCEFEMYKFDIFFLKSKYMEQKQKVPRGMFLTSTFAWLPINLSSGSPFLDSCFYPNFIISSNFD